MNILFLSHYFPPETNAPASRTFENTKRWAAIGHKVTVVTSAPNVPDGVVYPGYENKWRQWDDIEGVHVLRIKTYIAPNKGFFRRILNYISFMFSSFQAIWGTSDAQIIVATSPQFFCALGGFLLSRIKGLPFVMEVRDLWPESIIAVGAMKNLFIISLLKGLEKFLYKNSDKIVVVTESFKKIIIKSGIPENKIEIIKNGADIKFFSPQKQNAALLPFPDTAFVVSYVGTLGMAHALDKVLCAAKNLKQYPDIQFLIVGAGAVKDKLLRIKKEKKLTNVIFIDRQPKNKIPEYYTASDVCLVTLRKNPLFKTVIPSKMFEIMAMEKPVILSVNGESKEILEKSRAGIHVEPENIDMFKKAILTLYQNPEKVKDMGKNGRLFVKQFYNRDQLALDYIEFLASVKKQHILKGML